MWASLLLATLLGSGLAATYKSEGVDIVCPKGYWCDGTNKHACASGTYTTTTGAESCTSCPPGKRCPYTFSGPKECPIGYYSPSGGATSCSKIPTGYFSEDGIHLSACASGSYVTANFEGCNSCEAGYYCPSPSEGRISCPIGYYQNTGGQVSCIVCPLNYSCTSSAATACGVNKYSPIGDSTCYDIPAGYIYDADRDQILPCSIGTYFVTGSPNTCNTTPRHTVSVPGVVGTVPCPTGTYAPAGSAFCMKVEAGFIRDSNKDYPVSCAAGTYSFEGFSSCLQCPPGKKCVSTDKIHDNIGNCKPGYYSEAGTSKCEMCPPNKVCEGDGTIKNVSTGHFTMFPPAKEFICPAGSKCNDGIRVTCPPGTYQGSTGQTTCTPCDKGKYCPLEGTTAQIPCPKGYYNDEQGQSSCKICPKGYYCDTTGLSAGKKCGNDDYAPYEGMNACLECPDGYDCTAQDRFPDPCPDGYYRNDTTHKCVQCPGNKSCKDKKSTTDCEAGYMSLPGEMSCHPVPPGYARYNAANDTLVSCEAGTYRTGVMPSCISIREFDNGPEYFKGFKTDIRFYSKGKGQSPFDNICEKGYSCGSTTTHTSCSGTQYSENYGQDQCLTAPPGFIVITSSLGPFTAFERSICPIGGYCKEGTRYYCPSGYYSLIPGARSEEDCARIPAGFYTNYVLTKENIETFYLEARINLLQCPRGHYCPAGNTEPIHCPDGTYTYFEGSKSVTDCLKCPVGFFCTSEYNAPHMCPAGTYGPAEGINSEEKCVACQEGYFCPKAGQTTYVFNECPAGSYCPRGSRQPIECPAGTYNSRQLATSIDDCLPCPEGYKCARETDSLSNTEKVKDCPKGEYCPAGTRDIDVYKCPAGTYNDKINRGNAADCIVCPAGYICDAGSTEIGEECPENFYCPLGTSTGTIRPCPAGTTSGKGTTSEKMCQPVGTGSYRLEYGKEHLCPEGTYSDEAGSVMYSDKFGDVNEPVCKTCEPGYYCKHETVDDKTISVRKHCPAGFYSGSGFTECEECEPGYYCLDEETNYGVTEMDMYKNHVCREGLYCPRGTAERPTLQKYACAEGYYCPEGTTEQLPVPSGYFSTKKGIGSITELHICPAGYYCPGKQKIDETEEYEYGKMYLCAVGHFCPEGSYVSTQNKCPIGTYNLSTGAPSSDYCATCPAGRFCEDPTKEGEECDEGYYCPAGAIKKEPCPPGTYVLHLDSDPDSSKGYELVQQCKKCPAGRYCDSFSKIVKSLGELPKCHAGFLCKEGATVPTPRDGITGDICPSGGYCEEGAEKATACPDGKYNLLEGGKDDKNCIDCPGGYYCNRNYADKQPCDAGYYCEGNVAFLKANSSGNNNAGESANENTDESTDKNTENKDNTNTGLKYAKKCPEGFKCPLASSTPIPCEIGTYQNAEESAECIPCEAGTYCPQPGMDKPSSCPSGYYCKAGAEKPLPCPVGTYSNGGGLLDETGCKPCDAGKYCPSEGMTEPAGDCLPGFVCEGSNVQSRPLIESTTDDSETKYRVCKQHHYCVGGATSDELCDNGYYSGDLEPAEDPYGDQIVTRTSKDSCMKCPAGKTCTQIGGTIIINECPAGYYCIQGSYMADNIVKNSGAEDDKSCKPGYICPPGSTTQKPCPDGQFCNSSNMSSGIQCTAGYMCTDKTETPHTLCPEGQYCPRGTGFETMQCPVGTFSDVTGLVSIQDCKTCTINNYCQFKGQAEPTGTCLPGYVCGYGCKDPKCADTLDKGDTSNLCQKGYYCPNKDGEYQTVCPDGYFRDYFRGKSVDDCYPCEYGHKCFNGTSSECDSGFYCPPPQSEGEYKGQIPCEAGKYCEDGFGPYKCKPGTWNNISGSATCFACDEGFYCNAFEVEIEGEIKDYRVACPEGYYCPTGSSTPEKLPCQPGTYSNEKGLFDRDQCKPCKEGYYCPFEGMTETNLYKCNDSFLCEAGSSVSTENLCPEGYFCRGNEATLCTAGKYCSGVGQSTETGDCAAGFYCDEGTAHPSEKKNLCPRDSYCPMGTDNEHKESCPLNIGYQNGLYIYHQCSGCSGGLSCSGIRAGGSPEACPAGYYCPQKKIYKNGDEDVTEEFLKSIKDKVHYVNDSQLVIEYGNKTRCPKGHYCPMGSEMPIRCDPGEYQDGEEQHVCKSCEVGHYSDYGADICDSCPQGYYCPKSTDETRIVKIECPAGTYGASTGLTSEENCTKCPKGYYCPFTAMTSPLPCPHGYYCESETEDYTLFPCSQGRYCPTATDEERPCPKGTYSPYTGLQSEEQCIPCDTGKVCLEDGATSADTDCPEGYYCEGGVACVETKTGDNQTNVCGDLKQPEECPAGSYCPAGSSKPIPCEPGYYSGPGQESCTVVQAGYYQNLSGQGEQKPCEKGYYCPENTSYYYFNRCPAGTYSDESISDEGACKSCEKGQYCDNVSLKKPTGKCAPGYYCQVGADEITPGDTLVMNNVENGLCSPGYYCPLGTSEMLPCPVGTFNPFYGAPSEDWCIKCPAGMYCQDVAMTMADINIPNDGMQYEQVMANLTHDFFNSNYVCQPGYYCREGETSSTPSTKQCAKGHYCVEGATSELQCAIGTYQKVEGKETCDLCTIGSYCPENGMSEPKPCPAGSYCPEEELTRHYLCPSGTSSTTTGLSDMSSCTVCAGGNFCPYQGQTEGEYKCKAGFYCTSGSPIPTPNITKLLYSAEMLSSDTELPLLFDAGACPTGSYCEGGSAVPTSCLKGTFRRTEYGKSESDCIPCTAGSYCNTNGLEEPSGLCNSGHYCGASSSEQSPDEQIGTVEVEEVTAGSINITINSAVLDINYQKKNGICPENHYCPVGSIEPIPCPPGYNSAQGSSTCSVTDPSKYTPYFGAEPQCCNPSIEDAEKPIINMYCDVGALHPDVCPKGTYINDSRIGDNSCMDVNMCAECPAKQMCYTDNVHNCKAGFFCEGGNYEYVFKLSNADEVDAEYNDCPEGYYCPEEASLATACPSHTYSTSRRLASVDECLYCQGGYYCLEDAATEQLDCPEGSYCTIFTDEEYNASKEPISCTKNHYCPINTATPIGCPAGMIGSSNPGGGETPEDIARIGCTDCTEGYYCPVVAGDERKCTDYSYCPSGSVLPIECPAGTFVDKQNNESSGLTKEESCSTCTEGYWCRGGQKVGICSPGYICLAGSDVPRPGDVISSIPNSNELNNGLGLGFPCPKDHFCFPESDKTEARPCPSGKYTANVGAWSETLCQECPSGYVCDMSEVDHTNGIDDPTVPFPCPYGYYCPFKSSPQKCPISTYGVSIGAQWMSVCHSCEAGYYCPLEGMSKLEIGDPLQEESQFYCTANHYCPSGVDAPIICPGGTYSTGMGLKSKDECPKCAKGYYCKNSDDPNVAEDVNVGPVKCPINHYCPEGTENPIVCPIGTYYDPKISDQLSLETTCIPCMAGHYCTYEYSYNEDNTGNGLEVAIIPTPCDAGYICTGGAFTPTPTTPLMGGYICPVGSYCPSGATEPMDCPIGTYNDELGIGSIYQCKKCPTGSYNRETGQRYCKMCGSTAYTSPYVIQTTTGEMVITNDKLVVYYDGTTGNTECNCIGHNRVYQYSDDTCVCINGFVDQSTRYVQSLLEINQNTQDIFNGKIGLNEDGKSDCVPIDHSTCQERLIDGSCIDDINLRSYDSALREQSSFQTKDVEVVETRVYDSVCNSKCGPNGGYLDVICVCYSNFDDDCDDICKYYSSTLELKTDSQQDVIMITPRVHNNNAGRDPYNVVIDNYKIIGDYKVSPKASTYFVDVTESGFYGYLDFNYSKNNVSQDTSVIVNKQMDSVKIYDPLICISVGDTIIFGINGNHIPEYTANSTLNNNYSFDTGIFRKLQQKKASNSPVEYALVTFDSIGVFTFNDIIDSSHVIIIKVLEDSSTCPSGLPFTSSTTSSLKALGIISTSEIIMSFDVLQLIYLILFVVCLGITIILYVYMSGLISLRLTSASRPIYTSLDGELMNKPLNLNQYLLRMPKLLRLIGKTKISKKLTNMLQERHYSKNIETACQTYLRYQRNSIGDLAGPGRIALLLNRENEIFKQLDNTLNTNKESEKPVSLDTNIKFDPKRTYDSEMFYDAYTLVPEFTAAHLFNILDNDTDALVTHVENTNAQLEHLFDKLNEKVASIRRSVEEKREKILQAAVDVANAELSENEQKKKEVQEKVVKAQQAQDVVQNTIANITTEYTNRAEGNYNIFKVLNELSTLNSNNFVILNDILDNPQNKTNLKLFSSSLDDVSIKMKELQQAIDNFSNLHGLNTKHLENNITPAGKLVDESQSAIGEDILKLEVEGKSKQNYTVSFIQGLYHPNPNLKLVSKRTKHSGPLSLSNCYFNYFVASNGKVYSIYNKVFVQRNNGSIVTLVDLVNMFESDPKKHWFCNASDYLPFIPTNPINNIQIPQDNNNVFSRLHKKTVTNSKTGLCVPVEFATYHLPENAPMGTKASVVALGDITSDPISSYLVPQQTCQLMYVSEPEAYMYVPEAFTNATEQGPNVLGLSGCIDITDDGNIVSGAAFNDSNTSIIQGTVGTNIENGKEGAITGIYMLNKDMADSFNPEIYQTSMSKISMRSEGKYTEENVNDLELVSAFANGLELLNIISQYKQLKDIYDTVDENMTKLIEFKVSIESANDTLEKSLKSRSENLDDFEDDYEALEAFQNKINQASVELSKASNASVGENIIVVLTVSMNTMIDKLNQQMTFWNIPLFSSFAKLEYENKMLSYTIETGNTCSTVHPITFPPFNLTFGMSGDNVIDREFAASDNYYIIPTPTVNEMNSCRSYISNQITIRNDNYDAVNEYHMKINELKNVAYCILKFGCIPGAEDKDRNMSFTEQQCSDLTELIHKIEELSANYEKSTNNEQTRQMVEQEQINDHNVLSIVYPITFTFDSNIIDCRHAIVSSLKELCATIQQIIENRTQHEKGIPQPEKSKSKKHAVTVDLVEQYNELIERVYQLFDELENHQVSFTTHVINSRALFIAMRELLTLKRDVLYSNRNIVEMASNANGFYTMTEADTYILMNDMTDTLAQMLQNVGDGQEKYLASILRAKITGVDLIEEAENNILPQMPTIDAMEPTNIREDNTAQALLSLTKDEALNELLSNNVAEEKVVEFKLPSSIIESDALHVLEEMPENEVNKLLENAGITSPRFDELTDAMNKYKIGADDLAMIQSNVMNLVNTDEEAPILKDIKDSVLRGQDIVQSTVEKAMNVLANSNKLIIAQEMKDENDLSTHNKELSRLQEQMQSMNDKELEELDNIRAETKNEEQMELESINKRLSQAEQIEKERLLTQQAIERSVLQRKLNQSNADEESIKSQLEKLNERHADQISSLESRLRLDEDKQRQLLSKMLENKRRRRETEVKYKYQDMKLKNETAQNEVKSLILALESAHEDTVELKQIEENCIEQTIQKLKECEKNFATKLENTLDPVAQKRLADAYNEDIAAIAESVNVEKARQISELKQRMAARRSKINSSKQVMESSLTINNNKQKTQLEKDVAIFDNAEKDAKVDLNLIDKIREKRTESLQQIVDVLKNKKQVSALNEKPAAKQTTEDNEVPKEEPEEKVNQPKVIIDMELDIESQEKIVNSCEKALDALDGKLTAEYDRQKEGLRQMIELRKRRQLGKIAQREIQRKTENDELEEIVQDAIVEEPKVQEEEEKPKAEETKLKAQIETALKEVKEEPVQDEEDFDIEAETQKLLKEQEEELAKEAERLNEEAKREMERIKEEAQRKRQELIKQSPKSETPEEFISSLDVQGTLQDIEKAVTDQIKTQQDETIKMLEMRKKQRLERLKKKQEEELAKKKRLLTEAKEKVEQRKKLYAEKQVITNVISQTQQNNIPEVICLTLQERHRNEFLKLLIQQQQEDETLMQAKRAARTEQYNKRRDEVINIFNKKMKDISQRQDADVDALKKKLRDEHAKEIKNLKELYGIDDEQLEEEIMRDEEVLAQQSRHMIERKDMFERQLQEIKDAIAEHGGSEELQRYDEEISQKLLSMHSEVEHEELLKAEEHIPELDEISEDTEPSTSSTPEVNLDLNVENVRDQLYKTIQSSSMQISAARYKSNENVDINALMNNKNSVNIIASLESECQNQVELFKRKIAERLRQKRGETQTAEKQDKTEAQRDKERKKQELLNKRLAHIRELEEKKNAELLMKIREKKLKSNVLNRETQDEQKVKEREHQKPEPTLALATKITNIEENMDDLIEEVKMCVAGGEGSKRLISKKTAPPFVSQFDVLLCQKEGVLPTSVTYEEDTVYDEARISEVAELSDGEMEVLGGIQDLIKYMSEFGYKQVDVCVSVNILPCRIHPYMRSYYYNSKTSTLFINRQRLDLSRCDGDELATLITHCLAHVRVNTWDEESPEFKHVFMEALSHMARWQGVF